MVPVCYWQALSVHGASQSAYQNDNCHLLLLHPLIANTHSGVTSVTYMIAGLDRHLNSMRREAGGLSKHARISAEGFASPPPLGASRPSSFGGALRKCWGAAPRHWGQQPNMAPSFLEGTLVKQHTNCLHTAILSAVFCPLGTAVKHGASVCDSSSALFLVQLPCVAAQQQPKPSSYLCDCLCQAMLHLATGLILADSSECTTRHPAMQERVPSTSPAHDWCLSLASHNKADFQHVIHLIDHTHESLVHCRAPGSAANSTEHVGNFTRLVRGQAPQPGAYHNVLRMRRWLVSLDSTYGVKGWEVCAYVPCPAVLCHDELLAGLARVYYGVKGWEVCTLSCFAVLW